ncbi:MULTISPECIES: antiviral reverse transcriptase Drt4 [unclassified Pseudoalteromonas]|uniref:antiviral reverse transcriptase Drt4 n=1 Tax=unclassified Pseudoalteromonas TaxID=194690 RepID=UPI00041D08AF|nr:MULTISPECIES: antiviral reverse transcriptase Drt4 [unclassified Pseudoalteromonas]
MDAYTKRKFYRALTRYNYFPNQKSNIGELPPLISTRQFTPEVCEALAVLRESDTRESSGYDVVTYNATRYNNAFRELSLIHPKAYALLASHLHDHWNKIQPFTTSESSIIKPEEHEDGRIMVMNYEDPIEKTTRALTESFGKRFQVKADISNCFNSIYSHAIAWGLVGFDYAKTNRQHHLWFNLVDKYQRKCKRNETQGIPIGSATSNISLEIILGKIDSELLEAGYHFHRYVDDYNCYCETNESAHQFLLLLGHLLARYKLSLNIQKTQIIEQPAPDQDAWVLELLGNLPSRLNKSHEDEPKLTASEAITFINHAILVNKQTPDGSVLKYAIQLIVNFLDHQAPATVYSCVLNLSWHYPILIPYLDRLIEKSNIKRGDIDNHLNALIIENCKHRRSDGICWPLHIMKKLGIAPADNTIDAIIASEDCVSLTILNSILIGNKQIVDFADKVINSNDNYFIDTYWLLLYQLFRDGDVKNAYTNIKIFDTLLEFDVNFIPGETHTQAEHKCDGINTGFVFGPIEGLLEKIKK